MDESDLIIKSLEAEPVKNLLGPVTRQLGLIAGDLGSICRFYTNQHLQRVFTKWAEDRRSQPLPPDTDLAKLLPLIYLASLQSDEDLQARWAALLESVVTAPDDVLPSFGQTLSQLTAREARYIECLYAHLKQIQTRSKNESNDLGEENVLLGIYDERLRTMSYAEAQTLKKELAEAELAIADLERLGIIAHRQEAGKMTFTERDLRSTAALSSKVQDIELDSVYFFTEYGISFVRAVTPARDAECSAQSAH